MKKRILVGLLSFAALAWNIPQSYALFGLCGGCCGCRHGCSKYSTYLCIRPYNAFSPVCCGSMCATGCCPMPFGCGPGCGPGMPSYGMPSCFNDCGNSCGSCGPCDSCCSSGCADGSCLPAPGPTAPAPAGRQVPSPMPSGPSVPSFTPPNPNPLPTSQRWPIMVPYGYSGVQTAAYHPAYYGGYQAPYYGYPQMPNYGYQPGYQPAYNPGYYPVPYPTAPAYQAPSYWYGGQN